MHTSGNIEGDTTFPPISFPSSAADDFADLSTTPAKLIDHHAVEWSHVIGARYWVEQTFEYTYPGPIHDLRQRLIAVPPDQHGDQRLLAFTLDTTSPLALQSTESDTYGNRIIRYAVPHVEERIAFDMKMLITRDFSMDAVPHVSRHEAAPFYQPTHLTTADEQIVALARRFLIEYAQPEAFAAALNSWIHATMRYGRGVTSVFTTAAEALQLRQGLCQDYAHVMLAVCRAAGLAARYVSGHLLGEGRSHAWVEVLVPQPDGEYRAFAFDPTNHRRTTPAYITIAVGRDYSDVSPTSGTFTAPYPGKLHATKRAGVSQLHLRHRAAG